MCVTKESKLRKSKPGRLNDLDLIIGFLFNHSVLWLRILPPERDPRIDQTADHAEVQTKKVEPRKDVVAANHHAQIRDADVLQTSNDRRGERRVVHRAKYHTVEQHKPHHTRQQKLHDKHGFVPKLKLPRFFQVPRLPCYGHRRQDYKQRVVVHEAVLAQFFRFEFLLHINSVCGGEKVVEEDKDVALEFEREVVGGGEQRPQHHRVDAQLHSRSSFDAQDVVLGDHRHEDAEPTQRRKHGQAQLLGAAQTEDHVTEVDDRQGPDLFEHRGVQTGEVHVTELFERVEQGDRGEHLTDPEDLEGGEVVAREHGLVHHRDHERRQPVEERRAHPVDARVLVV